MEGQRRAKAWVPVLVDEDTWREEVERFNPRSEARIAAERERRGFERRGIDYDQVQDCDAAASDGTRLLDMQKVYVPITDEPATDRRFGFVFDRVRKGDDLFLRVVAYGERHPPRGTRSVYQRAHKRLHGRYPDQERDS